MMSETLANIHMSNNNKRLKKTELSRSNGSINMSHKINSHVSQFQMRQENVKRSGSFVVGQKLRESKWFSHSELKIFCAVVESGFIIEQKTKGGDETTEYGIAMWVHGFEKSKNPDFLSIYTINENKGKFRVLACSLAEFWPEGTTVRINNKCDKTETPLTEHVIRNQIEAAELSKRKWHNTEHFVYFCRYGPVESLRLRKITDSLKWNTLFHKIRRLTAK